MRHLLTRRCVFSEIIAMISTAMFKLMSMLAFAMMLMTMVPFTAEMIMPILSYLLKKRQKLLLFIIGETFK